MMAETMYAWSRILYGAKKDDQGNVIGQKAFQVGDEVSQSKLGADDVEWKSLVDGGVVRSVPLPDDLKDPSLSPRQIMQNKLTAAQQGFDTTGPTSDLIKRFDDEGEVQTQEVKKSAATEQEQPAAATPTPGNVPSNT
jgi:hypothetical protein